MNSNVIIAIFRRNFYSYFSNPTGYVFICVYVLLSSFAAFWPNEFFIANLANLDQLNKYLPYILLVFIPAITMSIWAEERRQGTDELLLTIPAHDIDVVLGKYLAAVAIFTVALVFSLFCNFVVLLWLGNPDAGLFAATYIGYWFVGLAMLAVGMVASFLTGNLTVGFVLGALFNAPLAFAGNADVILPPQAAQVVRGWSLESQFRDFGRGVISLGNVAFFLLIVVVMLYLCMLLIGRRHWQGGRDDHTMRGVHYLVRAVALVCAALGLVFISERFDRRLDMSSEGLSSVSPKSVALVKELDPKHAVKIDAYISPVVPELYVTTRLNLLSALREFETLDKSKVVVAIHETEPLSDNAEIAEKQFGITGHRVISESRGAKTEDEIYLGVVIASGLNKVVIPFVDRGTSVEYEIARSIGTVSGQQRKKIGVLVTDAKLFGGFDPSMMGMGMPRPQPEHPLITELKKQYEVVQVNADAPITEEYDALLAVQPSSLSQEQLDNFVAAVKRGQPTAIFEDPFPVTGEPPATSAPKQPSGNPMFGGRPPMPKGNIQALWDLLGVDFSAKQIVWQEYAPIKEFKDLMPKEFVFVDTGLDEKRVFDQDDEISSKLQFMLFVFPGYIQKLNTSKLKFEELVKTGIRTGTTDYDKIMSLAGIGGLNQARQETGHEYTIAARISGHLPDPTTGIGLADDKNLNMSPDIDVVLVADLDLLHPEFFRFRAEGKNPIRSDFYVESDNVTFALNALDELAGDKRYIDIRKRRPQHRVLTRIEERMDTARNKSLDERKQTAKEYDDALAKAEQTLKEKAQEASQSGANMSDRQILTIAAQQAKDEYDKAMNKLNTRRDREIKKIDKDLSDELRKVQDGYKLWAVVLPPIPPLLVGLFVFFNRRAKEREGVARSRLKT